LVGKGFLLTGEEEALALVCARNAANGWTATFDSEMLACDDWLRECRDADDGCGACEE
jgi:hypothetical protein